MKTPCEACEGKINDFSKPPYVKLLRKRFENHVLASQAFAPRRGSKPGRTTDGKCARQYSRTLTKPLPEIVTQNGTQSVEEGRVQ